MSGNISVFLYEYGPNILFTISLKKYGSIVAISHRVEKKGSGSIHFFVYKCRAKLDSRRIKYPVKWERTREGESERTREGVREW